MMIKEYLMITVRRLFWFTVVFLAGFSLVMAQSRTNQEMSVEESYLQQSVEMMIIREQSRAENRDMKLIALEYIGDAINRGNRGEEVRSALEYLGMEGVMNMTRENGRIVNNYPDVRTKAATYLGEMGTPAAKTALLRMCRADNEPMVITEVIKSLAKIGNNDNDETLQTINWVFTRYDALNPDNLLALSALEAYEKLAEVNGGLHDPEVFDIVRRISQGPYIKLVQQRALQTLDILWGYAGSQKQQGK
jgi:hypothetical protein